MATLATSWNIQNRQSLPGKPRLVDMVDGDCGWITTGQILFNLRALYIDGYREVYPYDDEQTQVQMFVYREDGRLFCEPYAAQFARPHTEQVKLPSQWRRLWVKLSYVKENQLFGALGPEFIISEG